MTKTIKYTALTALTLTLTVANVPYAFAARTNSAHEASTSASPRIRASLRAMIQQAKIDSVSASALTVSKDGKSYTVNINKDTTKVLRRFGGKSDLIEFSVGNSVSIWGTYTDDTKTTINAKVIRNLSIQKRNGTFFGTVKSVGSGSFVMTAKVRGDQVVTLSASTKIVNRKNSPITASEIKTGDIVRVRGMWDRSKNTITEVTHIKDFMLPVRSPKPSTSASASASASASPASTQ